MRATTHATGPPWFTIHMDDGTRVDFHAVMDLQPTMRTTGIQEWTVTPWRQATAADVIREVERLHQLFNGLPEPVPMRFEGRPLTFDLADDPSVGEDPPTPGGATLERPGAPLLDRPRWSGR